VLVVGDVMVDRYYAGTVRRISPEAPVPVVDVAEESQRLGGAANVARNLRALGSAVDLVGVVGADAEGRWAAGELESSGVGAGGLVTDGSRPTTLKCRVVAHSQHVVRFDRERVGPILGAARRRVDEQLTAAWAGAHAVVVSDYGKGLVQPWLMARLRALGRRRRVPVAVDPKSPHFELYRGATVVTPNLGEALAAARLKGEGEELVRRAGAALRRRCGASILITRGEEGMTVFSGSSEPATIATVARKVYDVTGAGDTVVAVVALALAGGAGLELAAHLANLAAGVVVGSFGTASVTRGQLLAELRRGGAARAPRG
jgi:D-beta-D-heptose 7-phosphate kinase/D-beta-D-heptose 1-phosphate adenosyltransferase